MGGNEKKMHDIVVKEDRLSAPPALAGASSATEQHMQDISWESPEFQFFHKTTRWYVVSAIIALVCIAFGVFKKDLLFILLTVIAYITVVGWSQKPPRRIQYRLAGEGLHIHDRFYPYNSFAWFSIADDGLTQELILAPKTKVSSRLRIVLVPLVSPESIRAHLANAVRENKDFEEHFFDLLAKRIGF